MNDKILTFFYKLARTLFVVSLIFHVMSFLPFIRWNWSILVLSLAIFILLLFAVALKATQDLAKEANPRNMWKNLLAGVPRRVRIQLVVLFVYVTFNFFFSLLVLNEGLTPAKENDGYVLENKGKVIKKITEEQYYRYLAYEF